MRDVSLWECIDLILLALVNVADILQKNSYLIFDVYEEKEFLWGHVS